MKQQPNNPVPNFFLASAADFKKIPGSPIAYWASYQVLDLFKNSISLSENIETREGLTTGNNDMFLRRWYEVPYKHIGFGILKNEEAKKSCKRWFPYIKGGDFRRWSGNYEYIVNWFNDGEELRAFEDPTTGRVRSHNYNGNYAFRTGFTWSGISSATFAVRYVPAGFMFDAKGPMGFLIKNFEQEHYNGFLNSVVTNHIIKMLAPTLDFKLGHILNLPLTHSLPQTIKSIVQKTITLSFKDWDSYETSWDFKTLPLLDFRFLEPNSGMEDIKTNHQSKIINQKLSKAYTTLRAYWREMTLEMQRLEEENNRIFIDAYGLQDELTPDVPLGEITLTCNPHYRYGGDKSKQELEALLLTDTIKELISYAIGCMMGRYSLDKPGLIYAHSGNKDFEEIYHRRDAEDAEKDTEKNPLRSLRLCGEFKPDDDGIVPVMDLDWFSDDAANRFIEFLRVAWSPQTMEENLKFVADSLNPRRGEQAADTIRRYLSTTFFKDHLKTYKKRPIYWLFSSGKHKAFECLVYLHRYNESTLSRMRSTYVTPLQGKFNARMEYLRREIEASTAAAPSRKLQKDLDLLKQKQAELSTFDDNLRHYADMRITLDLDDGVKVNYGKFGNLLAEVKTITG